jgi:hypothetical protein
VCHPRLRARWLCREHSQRTEKDGLVRTSCFCCLLRTFAASASRREKAKRRRGSLPQDTRAWLEPLLGDALPVRPRFVTDAHPTSRGWETLHADCREIEIRRVRSGAFPAQRDGAGELWCVCSSSHHPHHAGSEQQGRQSRVGCSVRDVIDQLLSGSTPWLFSQDDMPVMRPACSHSSLPPGLLTKRTG